MRSSILALACGMCLVPLVALAIPPSEALKKQLHSNTNRPPNMGGTPSLSPPGKSQQYSDASRAPGGGYLPPGSRRPSPSILPTTPNYRPGSGDKPDRRPSAGQGSHDVSIYESRNRPPYNRPDVVIDRPDINISRPTINRPTININNTTINNNTINNNTTIVNQGVINRPVNNQYNGYPPQPRPYYPQLHHHWQPSSWSGGYRPAYYNYRYSTGSVSSMSVGGMTMTYVNPFYARPAVAVVQQFDYSQPIHVPDPDYRETQDDLVRSERAIRRFDDAREVFRRGEYGRANELIDEAIELLPNDPSLHQFRALVLAARQRFQESAAALYSVLAVSPGWNRETILKLYHAPETYVSQMGALERFATTHPEAIESRFLLAYHYLINGNFTGAKQQLEAVRIANPNDRVVQNLLSALG